MRIKETVHGVDAVRYFTVVASIWWSHQSGSRIITPLNAILLFFVGYFGEGWNLHKVTTAKRTLDTEYSKHKPAVSLMRQSEQSVVYAP